LSGTVIGSNNVRKLRSHDREGEGAPLHGAPKRCHLSCIFLTDSLGQFGK